MSAPLATADEKTELLETFKDLCEIPSPSGDERAIADWIASYLGDLSLDVDEDGAGATCGSNSGNLLARIPGSSDRWLMFCAHMDTVPLSAPVEVVQEDGLLVNRHETILGADNKAAVAVFLQAARRLSGQRPSIGVELLFTVGEENGLTGAKAFGMERLHAEIGYVFDHASPIGEMLVAAPTHRRLKAKFKGQSAHAGICPEDGANAIVAAAKAIDQMPNGRLSADTTVNVGRIVGGSAVNVVPELCLVVAEARSLDHGRAIEVVQEMIDACNWAAGTSGVDVKVLVEEEFEAFRLSENARSVQVAKSALRRVGVEPTSVASGGGSDANVFVARNLECLNLANGTLRNHTSDEAVPIEALTTMLDVSFALVDCAGETQQC